MQADLSLCWSHIPHCWKSHVTAHMKMLIFPKNNHTKKPGKIVKPLINLLQKEQFDLGLQFFTVKHLIFAASKFGNFKKTDILA